MDPDLSSGRLEDHRRLSLWWDEVPGPVERRPPLAGDVDVDVAVVGGGLTGLWTAYYLTESQPDLRVVVVEREMVGFGASGRNGGWCSALFAASAARLDRVCGPGAGVRMHRAMVATVGEVERVCGAESIDCGLARGGTVTLARTPVQLERAQRVVAAARTRGLEDDYRLLSADEAEEMVRATQVLGGVYTPHCAAIDPVRLVRGLARVVTERGVAIHETTTAIDLRPGAVVTDRGTVTATTVVRATEGYTPSLPGEARTIAPVYSLMVATEPLDEDQWSRLGLAGRPTFNDFRHLIIYGQRTEDGRLAFGGRGAPYHFGSAVRPDFDRDPHIHGAVHRSLVELFPSLEGVRITHRWGGPIGVPRDWFPSVGIDRATGQAWAGGYVGDGVATTNLAGRTLRDLILDRASEERDLPWVGHRSRPWEPEPLRYLGINAGLQLGASADRAE
ncbi:MAG: FAD-dependent oxidoreductase, partial [Acidimicrobiales bacterium]|nr:FAD-dependent oxidoreductase [Acidimicrobiales bacterium]